VACSIYHATAAERRRMGEKVSASFPPCSICEVARLGRSLRPRKLSVLAYFDTGGASNCGTKPST
jgi:hypothetical protein